MITASIIIYLLMGALGSISMILESATKKDIFIALTMPVFWLPCLIAEYLVTSVHFIKIYKRK